MKGRASDLYDMKECGVPKEREKDFINELGQRVRSVRLRHKVPMAEFARALHMTETMLARVEDGEREVDGWLVFILESSFSINANWLMTGDGEMTREDGGNRKELADLLTMYRRLSRSSRGRVINIIKMLIYSDRRDGSRHTARMNYED